MLETGIFRRRRLKLVRQTESAECGLACLATVLGYYGGGIPLPTLRQQFNLSSRGANLASLVKIADKLNFRSRALRLEATALHALKTPAILHWQMTHFVVVAEVKRGKALIYDPRGPVEWVGANELSERFTGIALELTPTPDFQATGDRKPLRLSMLWGRLSGLKRVLSQTLLLSFVSQVFTLASPYYMQIGIDHAVPTLDYNLVLTLALGFAALTIFNGVSNTLRGFTLLSAGSDFAAGLSGNLTRKLFRLPITWFERRHVGDVLSRYTSIIPIRGMLVEGTVAVLMDGILGIITLLVMLFYSVTLTLVSIAALTIYMIVRQSSYPIQRAAQEEAVVASGREQTSLIESIRGIQTIRLFGREALRTALWQSRLIDSMNSTIHVQRIGIWQNFANTMIFGLENIVVIGVGVSFIISGGFSVGMLVAFIAYKSQFASTMQSLVARAVDYRMLDLHLERLADIVVNEDDPTLSHMEPLERDLRGEICLRNIIYRYGLDEPAVLNGVNLEIQAGDSVAITGPSGGGKSTLIKILLGLVQPESGDILVDGLPIRSFGYGNYRNQVSAVMQDDALFEGTIAANIALFDERANIGAIEAAASLAAISEDIEAMPMKYDTLVGDMGSSLSGGQRQRLLLARALYRKPKLLIVDEGTSHLDTERERRVNAAISGLGITRIIVAHRKETIESANKVYILTDGILQRR